MKNRSPGSLWTHHASRQAAAVLGTLLVAVCAQSQEPEHAALSAISPTSQARAADSTSASPNGVGIAVKALRLSAAGYMLDMRYRITDVEKARPLLDRHTQVYLLEPETGARLMVPVTPTIGRLRQVSDRTLTDRTYFVLFANPGRYVKSGTKLTLVVGGQRIENLAVE